MSDLPAHTPDHPAKPSTPGGGASGWPSPARALNFIEQMVERDNAASAWGVWADVVDAGIPGSLDHGNVRAALKGPARRVGKPRVQTRFPPEPNGYLHIGHAKSICLNAGLARKYDGKFNLRFDDTNPSKEEIEYVESIKRDVKWLGADFENPDWGMSGGGGGGVFWASDYFDQMYEFAKELILKRKAYVCELTGDEVSKRRGSVGVPATSPFRDRPPEESMKLFREMKLGKHPDGSMTLRARIDLDSPNFNLRDPVMYRILHETHHNTGDKWCIYPMYDWAHGIEDSLEQVTHSICTLEFEDHRPLYDWFVDAINEGRTVDASGPWGRVIWHSQQIEFAKLRPTYTVMSKRNLLKMVQDSIVAGWDDPRMPTIAALRRRGYTPECIRAFCEEIGVTKVESFIDFVRLENAIRDDLNTKADRRMAVLHPLKLVIEDYPEGKVEQLDAQNNPESPGAGVRKVPFSRELYIERDDFMENPPKKYFRLAPGQEVRLRWGYVVKCVGITKDGEGNITEVRCTHDPATRGGDIPLGPDGKPVRKVQGTIHWVSVPHAVKAEVRLFDRLFNAEQPGERTGNWMDDLNTHSLEKVTGYLEPSLAALKHADDFASRNPRVQFERLGYFCLDRDSTQELPVWNRTVTLKDSWSGSAGNAEGGQPSAALGAPASGASVGGQKKGGVRLYSIPEAAHELKIKQDKLLKAIELKGVPGYAERSPAHLTLDEVRAMKEWLKANLKSLA